MLSQTIFQVTFYVYVLALIASIVSMVWKGDRWEKASFWLFLAGFLLHTAALFVRWGEAGEVEVAAFQQAEGRVLQGWEWFKVWISHPPWSNLYESLVCFGWGMSLVGLYGVRRFHIPILPVFAITLSLIVMGAASLLIDQEITPLVPALQSGWLHLHVTMATISYPAFGLAAVLALFYLLKDGVKNEVFGVIIALSAATVVAMVGGSALFSGGDYIMTLLAGHGDKLMPLTYSAQGAGGEAIVQNARFGLPAPVAGPAFLVAMVLFVLATLVSFFGRMLPGDKRLRVIDILIGLGFTSLSVGLIALVALTAYSGAFTLSQDQIQSVISAAHPGQAVNYQLHGQGPYRFSIAATPFEFLLILTAWLGGVFYFVIRSKREWLEAQLPQTDRLDDLSYKTILFAFPFMTLLIITGAIWAYYAWGRYWGWDPKETWSLITWIVYSIYLHARITHGWEGRVPAVIALVGFVVVIFTYLGVNILLSGLHSYASG